MNCYDCGKFFSFVKRHAWKMVYSGAIPTPDHEIFKCDVCLELNGPFSPQHGIKPEYSCGINEARP